MRYRVPQACTNIYFINEYRASMQSNMSKRLHLFFTDLAADPNSNRDDQRYASLSHRIGGRTIDERGSQIARIYHLSPVRQTNCNPKSLFPHRIVSNQKHSIPLTNADQNSLETVF